jgi:hypothetical protein
VADYNLLAQYPKQAIVRDRNYSGLLAWAGYQMALPIPATRPEQAWVEQRLLAERIPTQIQTYVDRTMGNFMMSPNTQAAIRDYLSQWNDEALEEGLSADISTVLASFMPAFAAGEIPQEEVDNWYLDHGFS